MAHICRSLCNAGQALNKNPRRGMEHKGPGAQTWYLGPHIIVLYRAKVTKDGGSGSQAHYQSRPFGTLYHDIRILEPSGKGPRIPRPRRAHIVYTIPIYLGGLFQVLETKGLSGLGSLQGTQPCMEPEESFLGCCFWNFGLLGSLLEGAPNPTTSYNLYIGSPSYYTSLRPIDLGSTSKAPLSCQGPFFEVPPRATLHRISRPCRGPATLWGRSCSKALSGTRRGQGLTSELYELVGNDTKVICCTRVHLHTS